jgi:hypothetical protein
MIDRRLAALAGGVTLALALGSGAAHAAGPGSGSMHEDHVEERTPEPDPVEVDTSTTETSAQAGEQQSAEAAKRRAAQARQRARQAQRARAQRKEQARQAELARQQEEARAAERALAEQEARRQQELARERARAQAEARARRTRFALELGVGSGLAAIGVTGMAVLGGGLYLDRQRQQQLEGLQAAGIDPKLVDLAPLDAQGQRARAMITVGAIAGTAGLLAGGTMISLALLHRKAAAEGSGTRASLRVQPTLGGIRIEGRF